MSTEKRNIGAFTAAGCHYPAYVSFNVSDAHAEITVRSEAKPDGSCGADAIIKMETSEFLALLLDAQKRLCGE